MKLLLVLLAVFALTASAADISGTWKASIDTPNGPFESVFNFKVDGAKVTGTASNQMIGELPISDGKLDGDTLTFGVTANFNGNEAKLTYKGKVKDNEISFTVEIVGAGRTFEMTAKKV